MKKVAHYASPYLSLTKTWLYSQIANLERFEPIVICRSTENLDQFPAERIVSFSSLPFQKRATYLGLYGRKRFMKFFEPVIEKERPTVIHAHFGNRAYEIFPLAKKADIPLVTSFYGYDVSRLPATDPSWHARYRKLFDAGAVFLAEGSHIGSVIEQLGCVPEKIRVLRLGINLDKIPYRKREEGKQIKVLAAGSFREKKGYPFAIEAFARIARKHKNMTLTIVGGAREKFEIKEKKKMLDAIDKFNIVDLVHFVGYLSHEALIREFYDHHIFISPSVEAADGDTEGGAPVTIIEASASGLPILSTTHCDIPEVVANGVGGFLVPERNSEALAEKLDLLCSNPQLRAEMGVNGRKHIEEHYDIKKQVRKLENIYEDVICEGGSR